MDDTLSDLTNIDEALQQFQFTDLYRAGIKFFISLNFPVFIIKGEVKTANVNTLQFLNDYTDHRVYLSDNELDILQHATSISYLFKLSRESVGLQDVRPCKVKKKSIKSIVFLAVDLTDTSNQRSHYVYYLTQIISKCFASPVVLLYKSDNEIALAGLDIYHEGLMIENVYLSDWYRCDTTSIAILQKLDGLRLENHDTRNFLQLFYDIIWAISRDYYIYPESNEFIKFGLLWNEYHDFEISRDSISFSYIDKSVIEEILEEKKAYYANLYGDDYIIEYQHLKMLIEEDDEEEISLDELLMMTEYLEYEDEKDTEDYDFAYEETYDETEDVAESYYDDPIQLLKLLNQR